MSESMEWIKVCSLDELPLQSSRVIKLMNSRIAVFRSVTDQVFALEDRCPHRGGPLSEGIVHGHRVTCPLHDWVIDLASGDAVAPDRGCARAYRSRVEGGMVYLHVEARTS